MNNADNAKLVFENGQTSIEIDVSPAPGPQLKMRGVIDQPNPGEFLDPLLSKLHEQALERRVPQVSADVSELMFLNSSGIKSLVKWILENQRSQPNAYRIRFLYAPSVTWQKTSLSALAMLSKELVAIEAMG